MSEAKVVKRMTCRINHNNHAQARDYITIEGEATVGMVMDYLFEQGYEGEELRNARMGGGQVIVTRASTPAERKQWKADDAKSDKWHQKGRRNQLLRLLKTEGDWAEEVGIIIPNDLPPEIK